jgi:hypothetical protein
VSDSTYYFRVRAQNGNNLLSAYDAVITTYTKPGPPLAPSSVQSPTRSTSSLTWTWTDNSNNEQGFRVRTSSDGTDLSSTCG